MRVGVEIASNFQINNGILWALCREQSLATQYPGRDGIWIQLDRMIQLSKRGACIGWVDAKDTLGQDVVEIGVRDSRCESISQQLRRLVEFGLPVVH